MRTPEDEDFDEKMQSILDFVLAILAVILATYVIHSLLT
jgi:hypothetical protein